MQEKIANHSDEVGASPVGAAPTTSSYLTYRMASMDWVKTIARGVEKYLSFEIWCNLYKRFYDIYMSTLTATRNVKSLLNYSYVVLTFLRDASHFCHFCVQIYGTDTSRWWKPFSSDADVFMKTKLLRAIYLMCIIQIQHLIAKHGMIHLAWSV